MESKVGNISLQNAVWYSANLEQSYQSSTRILPHVDVINIGNKTYTGQVMERLVSNMVGECTRPVFQGATIRTFTATVSAYECPCFVPDTVPDNVQFGREILGKVASSIGLEMGRRADKVFLSGMNAVYDTDNTIDVGGYLDVRTISNAHSKLGAHAVRGEVICLINYDQFSNLLLDDRFSSWFFNANKPLAEDYGEPANDYLMRYQGITFTKLPDDSPLPLSSAGKRRLFMFSRDACKFLSGDVEPYGNSASIMQFHVHRGGYDFNNCRRMGYGVYLKIFLFKLLFNLQNIGIWV